MSFVCISVEESRCDLEGFNWMVGFVCRWLLLFKFSLGFCFFGSDTEQWCLYESLKLKRNLYFAKDINDEIKKSDSDLKIFWNVVFM